MKKKMVVFVSILIFLILFPILVYIIYTSVALHFGGKPHKSEMAAQAMASVYEKGRFKNQNNVPVILPKIYRKILRMQFDNNPARIPESQLPSLKPTLSETDTGDGCSVIWLGHSSVLIRIDGHIILIDPVFSRRASPVSFIGPMSFEYAVPITADAIPYPDIILISHDHYDHLDYHTIKDYYSDVQTFIVPLGVKSHLVRWGIPEIRITELDWWSEVIYKETLIFTATPAQHFTGRRGQNNSTLWCSWVIKGQKRNIFFSGDSGYSTHFSEIGEKFGPFDIALVESGAYGAYWPYIHMIPEESVQAHIDLKGKVMLPIHWGKFNLAFHPWKEPIERISVKAPEFNIVLATPRPGEEIILGGAIPKIAWWKIID